jgi:hypothetical protein
MLIEYQITCGFGTEVDLFIAQFILQLLCIRTSGAPVSASPENQSGLEHHKSSGGFSFKALDVKTPQQALANETLQCYAEKHPQILRSSPPFLLPLVNFLWFLLLAIDSGKTVTFKVLCELYSTTLTRDPSYKDYLTRIGEIYFGVQPPTRPRGMGGLFGNLIQSLFDDGDDDDEEEEGPVRGGVQALGQGQAHAQPSSQSRRHQIEDLD